MAVLEALRRREGKWVPARALAEGVLASPEKLEGAVEALRSKGYEIEHQRESGYRFLGCGDRIVGHEVARELATELMGNRIITLERTTSTNDVAWQEAFSGAAEGTVVFAEEQTAGRGRMGREWNSPPRAGLLMSVVLRPELGLQQAHLLTVITAVAVAQALREHLHLPARIRWPNDITIRDRKVAGILVEGRSLATGSVFVLGIGVNVSTRREEFPPELRDSATALATEANGEVSRVDTARWILHGLERWYRDLRHGDYGRIARHWRRLSSTLGRRVVLTEATSEFRGRVLDLSLEDGLIVRLDEGVTRIFHAATATLRQLPETWQGIDSR